MLQLLLLFYDTHTHTHSSAHGATQVCAWKPTAFIIQWIEVFCNVETAAEQELRSFTLNSL